MHISNISTDGELEKRELTYRQRSCKRIQNTYLKRILNTCLLVRQEGDC